MSTIAKFSAVLAALVALAPIPLAATAHADDGAVYFSHNTVPNVYNCAILANGTIGCDNPVIAIRALGFGSLPLPWPQPPQTIADPMVHSGYDFIAKPYTLPGGNPPFEQVTNDRGALVHAGKKCGYAAKVGLVCGTPSPDGGWESGQHFVLF